MMVNLVFNLGLMLSVVDPEEKAPTQRGLKLRDDFNQPIIRQILSK